jgi:hypothetical protein
MKNIQLIRLSDLTKDLETHLVQRYLKAYNTALKSRRITAVLLPERFTLPGGRASTAQPKTKQDQAIKNDDAFQTWQRETLEHLRLTAQRLGSITATFDALSSGAVDFDKLADQNRRRLTTLAPSKRKSRRRNATTPTAISAD